MFQILGQNMFLGVEANIHWAYNAVLIRSEPGNRADIYTSWIVSKIITAYNFII